CFNDARAWYVYECAARRGLTVGKDISVVGVDNHRVFAETLEPQLTTVELPHYEMGYWSACKLISMIEGKDVDTSSCPSARASLPPLDAPIPAKIHCALLEKDSVIS
ncbi:substrate-binding domain-containing protein, partial [Bifidobacterium adolescentis]